MSSELLKASIISPKISYSASEHVTKSLEDGKGARGEIVWGMLLLSVII